MREVSPLVLARRGLSEGKEVAQSTLLGRSDRPLVAEPNRIAAEHGRKAD